MSRKALEKLAAFYKTPIGQDVIETGGAAVTAAVGQALLTDMTLEEILGSTALGVGAAAVGRPLMGRGMQALGTRLDRNPAHRRNADIFLEGTKEGLGKDGFLHDVIAARFAPYAHLSPSAQLGQFYGRTYGDNVAQGLVAVASPFVLGNGEEA